MIKNNRGYSTIEFLLVLGLLLVFTLGALVLVRSGSDFYKRLTASKDVQTDLRIATAYLSNKLRQNDVSGNIQVKTLEDGQSAIVITENLSGVPYDTWIFTKDGYLKEVLVPSQQPPDADFGFDVIRLSSLNIKMLENKTLQMNVSNNQQQSQQLIYKIKTFR